MIKQHVIVTTKHGNMPTFAARPEGPGQFQGIIFYMDAPGIREDCATWFDGSPSMVSSSTGSRASSTKPSPRPITRSPPTSPAS